jgi:peptide/nickel transport system permease protein
MSKLNAEKQKIKKQKKHSQVKDVLRRLTRNKVAMLGLCLVLIIVLATIFAPLLTPYDYAKQDPTAKLQLPSLAHPLGTDDFGRDLLSRILYGGRISLLVSIISVCLSVVVGGVLGSVAGYFGGLVDNIIMRIMDVVMAIPSTLLAVAISAALGEGVVNTAIAISVSGIPSCARLLKSTIMTIRDNEFVEAARATGSTDARIIIRHILPNTISPIIVDSTLRVGMSILAISGLSFIGLGVQPPTPEWGSILASGRAYIRDFWPLATFPGLAIVLTLLGFNLLGDGLRDALDPKLKR